MNDAFHPQALLAYELNDKPLPIANGAPIRLRVERKLGYKHAKYVMRIELVQSYDKIAGGKGGYWEDQGYEWYAGIYKSLFIARVAARRPVFFCSAPLTASSADRHTSRFAHLHAERSVQPLLSLRRTDRAAQGLCHRVAAIGERRIDRPQPRRP